MECFSPRLPVPGRLLDRFCGSVLSDSSLAVENSITIPIVATAWTQSGNVGPLRDLKDEIRPNYKDNVYARRRGYPGK